MKKQLMILAGAITALAFFSCSKEKIETQPGTSSADSGPRNTAVEKLGTPSSLNKNLEGWFAFNGNLQDKTGKLADALPSTPGADIYTDDRKGNVKSAIKFDGRYGLDIFKVPLDVNMSVAVWAKYDPSIAPVSINYFVKSRDLSPDFSQDFNNYWGVISTPSTSGVPSPPMDGNWHHLAATYDGTTLKFYVDGSFVGSSLNQYLGVPYAKGATVDYQAGYTTLLGSKDIFSAWSGSLDDLRFYTRILSDSEIKTLYMQ